MNKAGILVWGALSGMLIGLSFPLSLRAVHQERAQRPVGAVGRIEPRSRVIHVNPALMPDAAVVMNLCVEEGCAIAKGQLLAVFQEHPLRRARYDAACADVDVVRAHVDRAQIAQAHWEREKKREAQLQAAKAHVPRETDKIHHFFLSAQAECKAAQAELKEAIARQVEAQVCMEQAQLRAPMDGVVLKIFTWPGEKVKAQGVLSLANLDHLEVVAEVHEQDLPWITLAQSAEVQIPGESLPLKGIVRHIGFQIKKNDLTSSDPHAPQDSRVVEVRLELPQEASQKLRHCIDMQVFVRFLTESSSSKK